MICNRFPLRLCIVYFVAEVWVPEWFWYEDIVQRSLCLKWKADTPVIVKTFGLGTCSHQRGAVWQCWCTNLGTSRCSLFVIKQTLLKCHTDLLWRSIGHRLVQGSGLLHTALCWKKVMHKVTCFFFFSRKPPQRSGRRRQVLDSHPVSLTLWSLSGRQKEMRKPDLTVVSKDILILCISWSGWEELYSMHPH